MIIIVEGSDKVGKSTIIQDLVDSQKQQHKDPVVLKLSQKPKNDSESERLKVKIAYQELFEQAKKISEQRLVIFDRAYPSEMTYSVKRKYDAMKDKFWWDFDSKLGAKNLSQMKVLLIYCTAPIEIIKERMKKENEEFLKVEETEVIQRRYEQFLKKTYLPHIVVDTTKNRIANLSTVKNLIHYFEHNEHL